MDSEAVPAYAREGTAAALREVDKGPRGLGVGRHPDHPRAAGPPPVQRADAARLPRLRAPDRRPDAPAPGLEPGRGGLGAGDSRLRRRGVRGPPGPAGRPGAGGALRPPDGRGSHAPGPAGRARVPYHNPASNAILGYGIFPLARFLAAGGLVGLGVDGAGNNNGQNMFESMKLAMLFQKALLRNPMVGSAALALELATRASARALEVDAVAGSLEVGKGADLIVVPVRQPHLAPFERLVSNLVYAGTATRVGTVMIRGEIVLRDGRHALWDEEEVIEEAQRAQQDMITEARAAGVATPWAADSTRIGSVDPGRR